MTTTDLCFATARNGRDCMERSHPDSKAGLCLRHWRQAAEDWCEPIPVTRERCTNCRQLLVARTAYSAALFCTNPVCGYTGPSTRVLANLAAVHEGRATTDEIDALGLVYYLRFGDRIKIGTTTNLRSRIHTVSNDECMAVEPGSYALERARHQEFAALLVSGQREWFHVDAKLTEHIYQLRRLHGDPLEVADNLLVDKMTAKAS